MLAALLLFTTILPIVYTLLMQFRKEFAFEAAPPLTFNLKNCEIIFARDDEQLPSQPHFLIEVPGKCNPYQYV